MQDRYDVIDEVLQAARQKRRHDVEAVGGALGEPLLDLVGCLLGSAGEDAVAASGAEAGDELTQGEAVTAGEFGDEREAALVAVDVPFLGQLGQWPVQRQSAQIGAEHPGQLGQPVLRDLEVRQLLLQCAGLGLRGADDGRDAGKHQQLVPGAAVAGEPGLDVLVEGLAVAECLLGGEDGLGVLGGELLAVLRRTGLHQQRVALRGARYVQGALHREVLPAMVDLPHLVGVGVDAALTVEQDGVVLPAVPQLGGDLDELARPLVAQRVLQVLVLPEVAGLVHGAGGDDVPAGPAAADVVQGGELAGGVEGLVEGGGDGGDQAHVLGDRRQGRQQGERFEAAERVVADLAPQGQSVGEEDGVEQAALGGACEVLEVAQVGDTFGLGARMPPGGVVVAGVHQESVEMQLTGSGRGHGVPRIWGSGRSG
ncbi:hypothetical protein GCM10020295_79470 [Streptomyces cinereospinus]